MSSSCMELAEWMTPLPSGHEQARPTGIAKAYPGRMIRDGIAPSNTTFCQWMGQR